jgi:hypothetical protein
MTKRDDAVRLLDFLHMESFNRWCPYSVIRGHFDWGAGKAFYDRISCARALADEHDLCLTFDLYRYVQGDGYVHGLMLTQKDTHSICESAPTRLSAIASQSANVGRAMDHVQRHTKDRFEALLAQGVEEATDGFARMMTNYGAILRAFADMRRERK